MNLPDLLAGRPSGAELTQPEFARYSRHVIMPEVGLDGQRKLKAAKVLVIGTGGLGSPLALYLAAAGVGTLGLVDFDTVDASNLQRQIIHGTRDVGRSKCASAADKLRDINPHVNLVIHEGRLMWRFETTRIWWSAKATRWRNCVCPVSEFVKNCFCTG